MLNDDQAKGAIYLTISGEWELTHDWEWRLPSDNPGQEFGDGNLVEKRWNLVNLKIPVRLGVDMHLLGPEVGVIDISGGSELTIDPDRIDWRNWRLTVDFVPLDVELGISLIFGFGFTTKFTLVRGWSRTFGG